jgi:hypothetical protein
VAEARREEGEGQHSTGLDSSAADLIYAEQPLHRTPHEADPLVILNKLDNIDKHRLLHPAFVYTAVERGLDLIEVVDRKAVKIERNLWTAGEPLEDGTDVALFMVGGGARGVLRSRRDAEIRFASGEVGAPRTGYADMVDRVRGMLTRRQR